MALIACPECERQISSYAVACPSCGFPLAMIDQLNSDKAAAAAAVAAAAAAAPAHAGLTPGAYMTMGNWGGEDIEWFVLKCDDEKALVLSEYGIDCRPYNELDTNVDWVSSSIRKWLNGEFLQNAFTPKERARILVSNEDGVTTGGHDDTASTIARQKVFLLSLEQADALFDSNEKRVCLCTAYAKGRGVWTDAAGACRWWLRTPSKNDAHACMVLSDGTLFPYGSFVDNNRYAVRPAFWVSL